MGTFNILQKLCTERFEYKNESLIIVGDFTKDMLSGNLQSLGGHAYRINEQGEKGAEFGFFTGYVRDGEIKYSTSEMSRTDANAVWDAIDEIEQNINNEDNE